jgi:hypothetical protein
VPWKAGFAALAAPPRTGVETFCRDDQSTPKTYAEDAPTDLPDRQNQSVFAAMGLAWQPLACAKACAQNRNLPSGIKPAVAFKVVEQKFFYFAFTEIVMCYLRSAAGKRGVRVVTNVVRNAVDGNGP